MTGAAKIMGALPDVCRSLILISILAIRFRRASGMFRTIVSYTMAATLIVTGSLIVTFGSGGFIAVPKDISNNVNHYLAHYC